MGERHGRVVDYDARRGLGTVEDGDGRRFGFHCTGLEDRDRELPAGTAVSFRVRAGHLGAWEADAVRLGPPER
jgi:cold shock CspA family protein